MDLFIKGEIKNKVGQKCHYSIKSIFVQILLATDKPVPDFTRVGGKLKRLLLLQYRGQQNFSIKGQIAYIFSFAGHTT